MVIKFEDQWAIMVKDDTLRQNSQKPYEVEFQFSEGWDGFNKTAIFEAGPASIVVTLTEDRCAIPAECLKHPSVKLKIGVYGVKGEERKGTVWCLTSMIVPDGGIGVNPGGCCCGGGSTLPDDAYNQIMAAIGDLSAAGFEGKTLAEVFKEIRESACGTATDEEVDEALNDAFGSSYSGPDDPEGSGEEDPDNTATDEEVDQLLKDVFG